MSDDKKKDLAKIIAGRMGGATQQIDAVRSTRGQIKGALTKDTLYRLRQAVADHQKADDESQAAARLAIILGLCDTYVQRHSRESDARAQEKLEAVDKIQEQAMGEMRDWGRKQAEAVYVRDGYAGGRIEPSPTPFVRMTQTGGAAAGQAKLLAKGKAGKKEGFNQATLDLIKKYGLTEAEVLAVKVYSSEDYGYINPAIANNESWMAQNAPAEYSDDESESSAILIPDSGSESEGSTAAKAESDDDRNLSEILGTTPDEDRNLSEILGTTPDDDRNLSEILGVMPDDERDMSQLLPTPEDERELWQLLGDPPKNYFATKKGQSHLKQLFEEGSLHGALAISALQKLPALEGTCYRGERLTEAEFSERYEGDDGLRMDALTSCATTEAAARKFANKGRNDAKRVWVLSELKVKTGRDIGDLAVLGRAEKEWLLLPGTVLKVDSFQDLQNGPRGEPEARRWVYVRAHEA